MKSPVTLTLLISSLLLCSCSFNGENNETPVTPPENNENNNSQNEDDVDLAIIEARQDAITEIENYVLLDDYYIAEQLDVLEYIKRCRDNINSATTVASIEAFLNMYKTFIDSIKTKEEIDMENQPNKPTIDDIDGTEQIHKYELLGYSPIYKDNNYKDGYIVTKPTYGAGESPYHSNYLKFYNNTKRPTWGLAQWNSKYDLLGSGENDGYTLTTDDSGLVHTITSKGKIVNGKEVPAKVITIDSKTGEVYLECNCSVEYDQPRTGSEGWVHLLHEQGFDSDLTRVGGCSSIIMESEYTVEKCINKTGSAYNTNVHAAQLVWYITIQNRRGDHSTNPDYGKYIWFGICMYDNRNDGKSFGMYRAHDAGTDTLIYSLSSDQLFANGKCPTVGQKAKISVDIVPIARDAFDYAKANGYLGNTQFEDLYIGGTNYGYEVPGTFDIATTIHSINIFKK